MRETPAPRVQRLRRLAVEWSGNTALYLFLLLLVYGLTVPLRGLWQDDTLLLRGARVHQGHGFLASLYPAGSPLRRLYTLPHRLALATPQVVWTLHLIHSAIWFGQALASGWIASLLLPGRRLTRFLAICLTLTATSDYLTGNLTALGYNFGALLFLLALGCSLRYVTGGNAGWVVVACATAAASIWTIDVAIPALPFVPLLLFWRGGRAALRRTLGVLVAVGVALAPAVPVEWRFLRDPSGYAAVALQPMSPMARLHRAAVLWGDNFAPWRWVYARPIWYPRPPREIPLWAMRLAAVVAAVWFALRARKTEDGDREPATRMLALAGLFAAMAFAANAAYAALQMAEIHYRTHILSRVWASLAVAVLIGWAAQRWPRARGAMLFVPVLFVGFGVWGGLERQDLWVSTWRLHKKELGSIVNTVPALAPGTGIVLRSGPTPDQYLATEANYLAQSWLILLYDDPGIHALRIAPDRGSGCRATPEGLECWDEGDAACFAAGTCAGPRFPYDTLVLLDFDHREGTWNLLTDPRGDRLLGTFPAALTGYRPGRRILKHPLTARQRALLLE